MTDADLVAMAKADAPLSVLADAAEELGYRNLAKYWRFAAQQGNRQPLGLLRIRGGSLLWWEEKVAEGIVHHLSLFM